MDRPYGKAIDLLRHAGLRPTRQRVGLSRLLFDQGQRHVTADQLRAEAEAAGISVSLATVYNTLHQLRDAGLLVEVVAEPGRSYFDTNVSTHHHFFNLDTGELTDFSVAEIDLPTLPTPPAGTQVEQVAVVVRIRNDAV